MSEDFELLVNRQALHGQSPLWMHALNAVRWVDVLRREVHTYHRNSGNDEVSVLPAAVASLAASRSGQVIVAAGHGFARLSRSRNGLQAVAEVPRGDRMSEGACDPAGRFLAGTVTHDHGDSRNAVYVLDSDRARLLVDGLTEPGGMGWSPDGGTMYLVDSEPRVIRTYAYDAGRGQVGAGRRWVVCSEPEGIPRGIAVDREGCVWVALEGTGRIHRYRPNGDLETVLWAPTTRITGLAFGGRRLDEMYVTSACAGFGERALRADPYAGALLRFRPGAVGLPDTPWDGR
ncbi:gluconolactonase [Halopolyspora algeriensis]|uniref:Gluconolactonase n=1 Tax=Halopolyspora algeriensis TaxID=1500506 RepID=A0A368VR58_9ACTN|nr:SMP-30/gluconolactonase/LRE family protein [Halopolyspora algeriensis]RCW44094.1 gluconolactonase [Halopolyspora algeriensis]TQM53407.1 gluconolactonase [Halopolyspora algeriensis]